MKTTEIRDMADADLVQKLKDTRAELFNLRFQLATGALDNTARMKELRHDVARIATVLREREIEAELDATAAAEAAPATGTTDEENEQ